MIPQLHAVEDVCPMRGGTQSHLMRCSDGQYYVVKPMNNAQGRKALFNELFASLLARHFGLTVPDFAVVHTHRDLILYTGQLVVEQQFGRSPWKAGKCFGSRYVTNKTEVSSTLPPATNLLSEYALQFVENLSEFVGALVFDKWASNCDSRQAVFYKRPQTGRYWAYFIDSSLCFGGSGWNLRDCPGNGIYFPTRVYDAITNLADFEPWIYRLQIAMTRDVLETFSEDIPKEWFPGAEELLQSLIPELEGRLVRIHEMLRRTHAHSPRCFRGWISHNSQSMPGLMSFGHMITERSA